MIITDPFYALAGAALVLLSCLIAATSNDRNGTLPMAILFLTFGWATIIQGVVLR